MQTIELSAGPVAFRDTGGDGPVLVFLHGLLMDATLWDGVVERLSDGFRCVVPTLPMGGHAMPARGTADLTPAGLAGLVAEFLDALGVSRATLVGNDTGGALVQLLIASRADRLDRAVLVSCDAFGNFPPGATGRTLVLTGKLPPALFGAFMQQLRMKPLRRLPISFGWLTKRGDATVARWLTPLLHRREIRRDVVRVLRGIARHRGVLTEAAQTFPSFDRPVLVVWARRDRVMPPEHGRRLASLFPSATLVEVDDSYTLVPLDQPGPLAAAIRDFMTATTERQPFSR